MLRRRAPVLLRAIALQPDSQTKSAILSGAVHVRGLTSAVDVYGSRRAGAASLQLGFPATSQLLHVAQHELQEEEKNEPSCSFGPEPAYSIAAIILSSHGGRPLESMATGLHIRRNISFIRFHSVLRGKKSNVPDAADCDDALENYIELRQRLDQIQRPASLKSWDQSAREALATVWGGAQGFGRFMVSVPGRVERWRNIPQAEWDEKKKNFWAGVKHEAHHYWVGTKLLGYDIKIASRLMLKQLRGKELTRRERAQLTRTVADVFRLVPMVIIVVVPFLEFLLPLLLRIFPNLLPSTYEDKLKKEEELKRRLAIRLELARFLQDTMAEMARDLAKRKGSATQAHDLYEFIKKVRAGEEVENADIIKFSQLFNDELTLDNLERLQLVSMCQFVGISPFGTDAFLRSRLRAHLRQIKHDDYVIEQEGLENLEEDELRTACRARGMRAPFGEGAVRFMQRQLRDWLDLSLHRGLPSSLLLMSRAFTITAPMRGVVTQDVAAKKDEQYKQLKETLGVIPEEVVESVAATNLAPNGNSVTALQKKLDLLKREEEAIKAELALAEAAAVTDVAKKTVAAAAAATVVQHAAAATALEASVSDEERRVAGEAAKDARMRAIVSSLMDLASGSGVAKERTLFMELVRKEIDRVNHVIAEQAGPGGSMVITGQGLQVNTRKVPGEAPHGQEGHVEVDGKVVSAERLSKRVTRMLESIEKELDTVESKIGKSMHVLDTDSDGVVSVEEFERALTFLRGQLSPEELQLLLQRVGAAASTTATADGKPSSIKVSELLTLAAKETAAKVKSGRNGNGNGAPMQAAGGDGAQSTSAYGMELPHPSKRSAILAAAAAGCATAMVAPAYGSTNSTAAAAMVAPPAGAHHPSMQVQQQHRRQQQRSQQEVTKIHML